MKRSRKEGTNFNITKKKKILPPFSTSHPQQERKGKETKRNRRKEESSLDPFNSSSKIKISNLSARFVNSLHHPQQERKETKRNRRQEESSPDPSKSKNMRGGIWRGLHNELKLIGALLLSMDPTAPIPPTS